MLITPPFRPLFPPESLSAASAPVGALPSASRLPRDVNPNNARHTPIQSTVPSSSHNSWDSSNLARDLHHPTIVYAPGAR